MRRKNISNGQKYLMDGVVREDACEAWGHGFHPLRLFVTLKIIWLVTVNVRASWGLHIYIYIYLYLLFFGPRFIFFGQQFVEAAVFRSASKIYWFVEVAGLAVHGFPAASIVSLCGSLSTWHMVLQNPVKLTNIYTCWDPDWYECSKFSQYRCCNPTQYTWLFRTRFNPKGTN